MSSQISLMQPLSLLIRNATIMDGTGNPGYRGDIAVLDDRIVAIGRFPQASAEKVVDAAGKVACPGFIDVHTHSEINMLGGKHIAGVQMGVTSEVTCPDGFCFAPLSPDRMAEYRDYLYGIYADADLGWDWHSFSDYLQHFNGRIYNNVIPQVPHGAVRLAVKGWASGSASDAELEAMCRMTRECMEAGATGISTGLDYAPASQSDLRELVEVSKVAAEYGGVYDSHIRGYGDELADAVAEVVAIAEQAEIAVHISHFSGKESAYAGMNQARARGIDITFDSYPYDASSTLLTFILPRTSITSPVKDYISDLQKPAARDLLRPVIEENIPDDGPAYFSYLSLPHNKWMEGKTVREVWRAAGKGNSFADFVCDLLVEEQLRPLLVYPWTDSPESKEERLRSSLTHPLQMVITDGIYIPGMPHPRGFGTYPRVLRLAVREKGWLRMEDAIRRMSSFPASRFGIAGRGLLKPGMYADIVIFDPVRVTDRATYEQPMLAPTGIEQVFVNGKAVIVNEQLVTGSYPGRLLEFKK